MKIAKKIQTSSKLTKLGLRNTTVRHSFRIVSPDDINRNRSSAYQYLVF